MPNLNLIFIHRFCDQLNTPNFDSSITGGVLYVLGEDIVGGVKEGTADGKVKEEWVECGD